MQATLVIRKFAANRRSAKLGILLDPRILTYDPQISQITQIFLELLRNMLRRFLNQRRHLLWV
jgi:hypothetical protein